MAAVADLQIVLILALEALEGQVLAVISMVGVEAPQQTTLGGRVVVALEAQRLLVARELILHREMWPLMGVLVVRLLEGLPARVVYLVVVLLVEMGLFGLLLALEVEVVAVGVTLVPIMDSKVEPAGYMVEVEVVADIVTTVVSRVELAPPVCWLLPMQEVAHQRPFLPPSLHHHLSVLQSRLQFQSALHHLEVLLFLRVAH